MKYGSKRRAGLGVLCIAFATASASAEQPSSAHGASDKPGEKTPSAANVKSDKAEARAAANADKVEAKAERAEAKAEKAEGRLEEGKGKNERGDARDGRMGKGGFGSAYRSLREELKSGKIDKTELKQRLAKIRETREDRRKEHREDVNRRWGAMLATTSARDELRHHARRMAFLNRALVLSETELTGKDKDKLVARVEKLIEKENERHEKAMDRLKSQPTTNAPGTQPGATEPASARPNSAQPGSAQPGSAQPKGGQ